MFSKPLTFIIDKSPGKWMATFPVMTFNLSRKGNWAKRYLSDWNDETVGGDKLIINLSVFKLRKNYYIYTVYANLLMSSGVQIINKKIDEGYFDGVYIDSEEPYGNNRAWYLADEYQKYYLNLNTKQINNLINLIKTSAKI